MPKAEPHFDAEALIHEVHKQDIGLRVTSNNPANFRQIVYKFARKLGLPIFITSYPGTTNSMALMKSPPADVPEEPSA